MDPKLESVPIEIDPVTIGAWLKYGGRYPLIIAYQWKEEFTVAGVNWAYALAWASVSTNHFADKRWVESYKLPDPSTGNWPEKGSQTMRQEIKFLAKRFGEIMRAKENEINQAEAIREYQLMQKIIAGNNEENRPREPEPTPPPLPETPPPPSERKPIKWGNVVAVILPIISILIWVLPIPEPIKAILKAILTAISGV